MNLTDMLRAIPPGGRRRPQAGSPAENGFVVNPLAATLFLGVVLIILVYTVLDRSGAMAKMGYFGPVLPMLIILWLMVGIYQGVKWLKRRTTRIRIKGPLFMRSLMNDCLERTCGVLEKLLNTPEISSTKILNAILTDKVLHICATDCLRYSDIRREIEGSRLKGAPDLELAGFLQTTVAYRKQPVPFEIQHAADTVSRSRPELNKLIKRLKDAHQDLCTGGTGNILALLPPDPKKVEKLRSTYRYRPPTPERAERMAFALESLAYLKATRHANVNPMDRNRYDTVAKQVIPRLSEALTLYKRAWQDLVDAFERPEDD
jgi:hypothetical protein